MQAFVDGKEIETRCRGESTWGICLSPVWDWLDKEYRVKPKKPEHEFFDVDLIKDVDYDLAEAALCVRFHSPHFSEAHFNREDLEYMLRVLNWEEVIQ